MTQVIVTTSTKEHTLEIRPDSANEKEIDFDKPGNRKWLMSHIVWAVKKNLPVVISTKS